MIYLNFVGENEKGICKKIGYQVKVMKKFYNIDTCVSNNKGYYIGLKRICFYSIENNWISKLKRKIAIGLIYLRLIQKNKVSNVNLLYIRYYQSSIFFLNFLKILKKNGKKIILELPTYPYDEEIKKQSFFTVMDKYYRKNYINILIELLLTQKIKKYGEYPV